MNVLLDTHAFLWMMTDETKLSPLARSTLADLANRRFLSSISGVELAIKTRIGKLTLYAPLEQVIREGLAKGMIEELPVRFDHAVALAQLPMHHRDPFDRLLIAQAGCRSLVVCYRRPRNQEVRHPHHLVMRCVAFWQALERIFDAFKGRAVIADDF